MGCGAQKSVDIKENVQANTIQENNVEINVNTVEVNKVNITTEININESNTLVLNQKQNEGLKEGKQNDKSEIAEEEDQEEENLPILRELLVYGTEELKKREELELEIQKKKEEEENKAKEQEEEEIPEDIDGDGYEDEDENVKGNKNSSKIKNGKTQGKNKYGINNSKYRSVNSNQNQTTRKGKKVIKKPFVITEIEDEPFKKIKITINACSFCDEYMMPIWCPKGIYLKFKVDGKWRIDKLHEYTNSRGIPSNQSSGFNYGALIGRIGKGDLFVVVDQGTVFVKEEGPLFLRQNLPKKVLVEPEGKLEVSVFDGIYTDVREINERIGWIENGTIDYNNDENENIENSNIYNNNELLDIYNSRNNNILNFSVKNTSINNSIKNSVNGNTSKNILKTLEKKLRTNLNNLRMNPNMYYEKFINFNKSLIMTKKYLDKLDKKPVESLIENSICYNYIDEYFQLPRQKQLQSSVNKKLITKNLLTINEDIAFFLGNKFGYKVKVKATLTQRCNPNEILELFLLDKKFRPYIFDASSKSFAVKIINNFVNESHLIIVAIIIDKSGNNKENENNNEENQEGEEENNEGNENENYDGGDDDYEK